MSDERRRRRRQGRDRRRRDRGQSFETVGQMQFPGMFGWLQRRQRLFYAVGIVVLVVSLGAVFFGGGIGPAGPTNTPTPEAATEAGDGTSAASEEGAGDSADATETAADDTEAAEATGTADDDQTDGLTYSAPPPLTIDLDGSYEAVIRTEKGNVRIELLPADAPGYVNNFVFLARDGFYDGITFHRVIPGFVAQAGDPTGTGFSSSGYDLVEELNNLPFDEGVLSMAKGGNSVSGSQFFITLAPTPHLEPAGFTVFGRVIEGLDVLRALTARDPQAPGQPPGDRILGIDIVEGGE